MHVNGTIYCSIIYCYLWMLRKLWNYHFVGLIWQDDLIWHYTRSGEYPVKSGYNVAFNLVIGKRFGHYQFHRKWRISCGVQYTIFFQLKIISRIEVLMAFFAQVLNLLSMYFLMLVCFRMLEVDWPSIFACTISFISWILFSWDRVSTSRGCPS